MPSSQDTSREATAISPVVEASPPSDVQEEPLITSELPHNSAHESVANIIAPSPRIPDEGLEADVFIHPKF